MGKEEFFRKRALPGREIMPSTAPGERIYAVGDIHGRLDLLRELLDRMGEHSSALPPAKALHIVFLGDLIDRGPDSAKVLELLYDLQLQTDRVVVLAGNHEDALLRALDGDVNLLKIWLAVGGKETLESFGLAPPAPDEDLRAYLHQIVTAIPRSWLNWLRRLPITAQSGDYFFCHAGIRPGQALRRQTREDLLWIRDEFLDDSRNHGCVVVHGHSIEPQVEFRPNRIGIDTGAYRTGVLTALYLDGTDREVLSVGGDAMGEMAGL